MGSRSWRSHHSHHRDEGGTCATAQTTTRAPTHAARGCCAFSVPRVLVARGVEQPDTLGNIGKVT